MNSLDWWEELLEIDDHVLHQLLNAQGFSAAACSSMQLLQDL